MQPMLRVCPLAFVLALDKSWLISSSLETTEIAKNIQGLVCVGFGFGFFSSEGVGKIC